MLANSHYSQNTFIMESIEILGTQTTLVNYIIFELSIQQQHIKTI